MSYTPTEWEPTDVVTATRMNALEQAVGGMNMSYTPNVWSDGDILSAEKMNALEQAVASGGGSSDFSTATVTLVDNTQSGGNIYIPFVIEGDISLAVGQITTQGGGTKTIQAIMYKEKSGATVTFGSNISVTGNIQDFGEGNYLITGDCTITIS